MAVEAEEGAGAGERRGDADTLSQCFGCLADRLPQVEPIDLSSSKKHHILYSL